MAITPQEKIELPGKGENLSVVSQVGAEAVRGLAGLQKAFVAGTLAAGVSTSAFAQQGNEYQVADAGPKVEGTVARAFDGLPMTAEEITVQAEMQRVASDVLRRRENGLEFYGPYLEEFSSLDLAGQYQIALLINAENSEGGPEYSQDTIDLVRNLRIPMEMIDATLSEAESNGADADWDIPAFEEVLVELRENGATESGDTFTDLVDYSPQSIEKIYFVYAVNTARGNLQDAQGRLVDAQGRLVDVQSTIKAGQSALDALNGVD